MALQVAFTVRKAKTAQTAEVVGGVDGVGRGWLKGWGHVWWGVKERKEVKLEVVGNGDCEGCLSKNRN